LIAARRQVEPHRPVRPHRAQGRLEDRQPRHGDVSNT
jgi:hypothetical protein